MHVRELPSGRWRVIVQHDGRRRSGTAGSEKAAKMLGSRLLLELGRITSADGATVADMIREHLAVTEHAPGTRYDADLLVKHLPDSITSAVVEKVTPLTVRRWYADLAKDGWTRHRVQSAHKLIRAAFTNAVMWGWLPSNPASKATPPAPEVTERVIPSGEQVARLLAAIDADDQRLGTFVRVAAVIGSRRGETAGLQWRDIDFDEGTIHVRRSVDRVPKIGLVISPTKTGRLGHRRVAVSLPTLVALRRLRVATFERGLAVGVPQDETSWVFTDDLVEPMSGDNWTKRFRTYADAAGLTECRLHDLRHFVATELLAAGVDVRTVAGRLGHANPATTLAVYAAFMPARDRAASELLEGRIAK